MVCVSGLTAISDILNRYKRKVCLSYFPSQHVLVMSASFLQEVINTDRNHVSLVNNQTMQMKARIEDLRYQSRFEQYKDNVGPFV